MTADTLPSSRAGTLRGSTHDPYARITELDDAAVAALAERIETRAANPAQHRLWREALARLPYRPGARLLEVGCGTGVVTALMAQLPGIGEVVGVDPSPGLVQRARERLPSIRLDVADGRSLPYPDASFDGVVFATTLCHVPDPGGALVEARRVLVPGGGLLVYDGDYASTTVAVHDDDPLQRCAHAGITSIVHDPWLVRRLVPLVRLAGFEAGELRSHGLIETDRPAYLLSVVDLGAGALETAGVLSHEGAEALRAEARHRAAVQAFFGHIGYASLLATKPED